MIHRHVISIYSKQEIISMDATPGTPPQADMQSENADSGKYTPV